MKNYVLLSLSILIISFNASAKLLDKIVAVVDDNVVTKSQVDRIRGTILPRRNILPSVFNKNEFSESEVIELIVQRYLVRAHLADVGYIISDDQVESRIKETEKAMGISRQEILAFLENNGMTFDEYFELVRESDETNLFNVKIIRPLISITEQEIKNAFYNKYAKKESLTLKFDLVDFYFPGVSMNKAERAALPGTMSNYQKSGNIPDKFKNFETNVLGQVTEEGLNRSLRDVLVKTDKGKFSNPIQINGTYHIFYVKNRDLVESDLFNKKKNEVSQVLYMQKSDEIKNVWFQKERTKHFVKVFQ